MFDFYSSQIFSLKYLKFHLVVSFLLKIYSIQLIYFYSELCTSEHWHLTIIKFNRYSILGQSKSNGKKIAYSQKPHSKSDLKCQYSNKCKSHTTTALISKKKTGSPWSEKNAYTFNVGSLLTFFVGLLSAFLIYDIKCVSIAPSDPSTTMNSSKRGREKEREKLHHFNMQHHHHHENENENVYLYTYTSQHHTHSECMIEQIKCENVFF